MNSGSRNVVDVIPVPPFSPAANGCGSSFTAKRPDACNRGYQLRAAEQREGGAETQPKGLAEKNAAEAESDESMKTLRPIAWPRRGPPSAVTMPASNGCVIS